MRSKSSTAYVYVIVDKRSEEVCMVGKTINPVHRWRDYIYTVRDVSVHEPLYCHMRKHGVEHFELRVHMSFDYASFGGRAGADDIAYVAEHGLITSLRAMGYVTYNLNAGGKGALERIVTDATRAKIAAACKGRKRTPEQRANMSACKKGRLNAMYGQPGTWTGRKHTLESCQKIAAATERRRSDLD